MNDQTPLQRHEKFFAFALLLVAIAGLVLLASSFDRGSANDIVAQGKLRIIDGSITGLLTILGMCAQALFRIGQTEKDNAEALKTLAQKAPDRSGAGATGEESTFEPASNAPEQDAAPR